ncbi:hypothetical protein KKG05_06515, partial [bacterium]|nr:hypothetical protein [bacterium]
MCRAFTRLGHRVELCGPVGQITSPEERFKAIKRLYGSDLPFPIRFFPSRTVMGRLQMLGGLRGALQMMKDAEPDLVYCRG